MKELLAEFRISPKSLQGANRKEDTLCSGMATRLGRGTEKHIFSVLLPTLCLHGDRQDGGGDVSG
jgi:hypothetical protein